MKSRRSIALGAHLAAGLSATIQRATRYTADEEAAGLRLATLTTAFDWPTVLAEARRRAIIFEERQATTGRSLNSTALAAGYNSVADDIAAGRFW